MLHAWGGSSFYALDLVREAMSRLYAEGTQDAFLRGNPVVRALRTIHALVFDLQSVRPFSEAAGRVFRGSEPQLPVFCTRTFLPFVKRVCTYHAKG